MANVKYIGFIKNYTDISYENMDVKNVRDMLAVIKDKYGQKTYDEALRSHIIVNKVSVNQLNGLLTKLGHEDDVSIIPVCGGG